MRIASIPALMPLPGLSSALKTALPLQSPSSSPVFGRDRLQLGSAAQLSQIRTSSQLDPAFAAEQAKIHHIGPRLENLPDFKLTPLRIGLALEQSQVRFSVNQATFTVHGPQGQQVIGEQLSGQFEAQALPGGFALYHNQQLLGRFEGRLNVESESPTMLVNGQVYRGSLELMPAPARPQTLQVINAVLLEDYLKSVVPSESPASWPLESLKAQALAARTYAVANWGKHHKNGFDMRNDTSDQVYKGVASEHPSTNTAVAATNGQIMQHGGRPITALFFSTSGGHTDSSEQVWGVALPYIQPVPDFDQASPRYRWQVEQSQAQLQGALQKLDLRIGNLVDIISLERTPQGRAKKLRLVGSQGSADVDANKFRFAAGLYSTLFEVSASGSGSQRSFSFAGGGWGHGLGMSQWGARQMAAEGRSAAEIVHHYYTDIEICSLD